MSVVHQVRSYEVYGSLPGFMNGSASGDFPLRRILSNLGKNYQSQLRINDELKVCTFSSQGKASNTAFLSRPPANVDELLYNLSDTSISSLFDPPM